MSLSLRSSGRFAVLTMLALAAALWLFVSPQAAHAGSVIGGAQVLDSAHQPVADARVSITDGAYTFDFVTDSNGIVTFPDDPGFPYGSYTVFVAPGAGSTFPAQYFDGKDSDSTARLEVGYGEPNLTIVLAAPAVTPATSVVAPAETALTTANRGTVTTTTTGGSLTAGSTTTVTAAGAAPGETVNAWFFSTPTSAGSHVVAANGTIVVTVPASLAAGSHRLVITDAANNIIGWTAVTVTKSGLASTGVDLGAATGGALAVLLLGAAFVTIRDRRSALV